MTSEQNVMHKLVYSELKQLISEVKHQKKSKSSTSRTTTRSSKYGNTLSPQQLPNLTASNSTRPKTAIASQNSVNIAKTIELKSSPSLPSLSPQRVSYQNVKQLDNITKNLSTSQWNATTPLEKMVEKEVSKRLERHMQEITENTHKLFLDSQKQMQDMTRQLHNALEQVHETKRQYDERSAQVAELISLLKNQQQQSVETTTNTAIANSNNTNSGSIDSSDSNTSSITFDSKSTTRTSKRAQFKQARARSASAKVRGSKSKHRPMTANVHKSRTPILAKKTRPELTRVSMYSSFDENRDSPLSVAIAGLDQIIFEIESSVSIRRPVIKLWPKLSSFKVNRLNPDIIHIGKNGKSWIIACKLHPNSPMGAVPFVINYQSQDNVSGNTVHHTTDDTFCVVNTADEIIEVTKERRNSKSKSSNPSHKNKGKHITTFASAKKVSKGHSCTEKKLRKKASMKTIRTRDRPITPAAHVHNSHRMNRKTSKRTLRRSKRKLGSTADLPQTKGRDYDKAMIQYANSLLDDEHSVSGQWQNPSV